MNMRRWISVLIILSTLLAETSVPVWGYEENSEEVLMEESYETDDGAYQYIRNGEEGKVIDDFEIPGVEEAKKAFRFYGEGQLPETMYLDVPELLQEPELPTGCESVSLTMALMYEGIELQKTTIAQEFLLYNRENDNMAEGYIGDPFTEEGAGCFAPAIVATAMDFFEDQEYDYMAYDVSDSSLMELLGYVAIGTPVVVWGTMYMEEPEFTGEEAEYHHKLYKWYKQEHCMLLSGYDLKTMTLMINDPLEGIVTRDLYEFERIYELTGKNAMVVKKLNEDS